MIDVKALTEKFEEIYGYADGLRLFFAPGRVNLIGEHIDYNGGFVFPAAIDRGNYVLVGTRKDSLVRLAADDLPGTLVSCDLKELQSKKGKAWGAYQFGVLDELQQAGYALKGMDMLFSATLPFGAGLSSSASIEVVTAYAALQVSGGEMNMVDVALLTQRAENRFVGVNCGIMDQFACANGKKGCGMLLDCASVTSTLVPLNMDGYAIVIGNTNKKRGLADSKYNERRAECEEALAAIQTKRPEVANLCQLLSDDIPEYEELIKNPVVFQRMRHVITENERVVESVLKLKEGDIEGFGKLLNESHFSLRDDYAVTGLELDAMTEAARNQPGCVGSRMTGAGFGGCTVSLVKEEAVDAFIAAVSEAYNKATGLKGDFYSSFASDGPVELSL